MKLLVSNSAEPGLSNSNGSKYEDAVLAAPVEERALDDLVDIHARGGALRSS